MKNASKTLTLLLLSGVFSLAQAQTAPASKTTAATTQASTKAPDCCMMKDGKMMAMQGGKTMPMTEEMTTADGCKVMTDGTCKMKDGTTMKMKNGQCMMMSGKMTTVSQMKKGGKMKGGSSKM